MKKELYEKPEVELISLVDIDIITSSAGEGGDVPVENEANSSNDANSNEIDLSPWTNDDSIKNHSFFDDLWNIFNDNSSESDIQDNVPTENEIQEEAPVEEVPVEEIPIEENISEEIPADSGFNDINE